LVLERVVVFEREEEPQQLFCSFVLTAMSVCAQFTGIAELARKRTYYSRAIIPTKLRDDFDYNYNPSSQKNITVH